MTRIAHSVSLLAFLLGCSVCTGAERRALVIGISTYPSPGYRDAQLKYAHLDAIGFASLLQSDVAGVARVSRLVDGMATREAIIDALGDLREGPPLDTLFVFFSGHAEVDSRTGQLYIMPYMGDRSRVAATGLSIAEFDDQIKAVGALHTLVFMDACHGGAALGSRGTGTGSPAARELPSQVETNNRRLGANFTFFLSASASEVSSEDEEYHQGIYTHFVIEGLRGAADGVDGVSDGIVTAGELKRYLEREVPRRVRTLSKPDQTPLVSGDFPGGLMLTARNVAPVRPSQDGRVRIALPTTDELSRDLELALMYHLAKTQVEGDLASPTESEVFSGSLRELLNAYRWKKSDAQHRLPQISAAVCSVISSDGRIFASLLEPATLTIADVESGSHRDGIPLAVPSNSAHDAHLDSCTVSLSLDDRYAAVAMKGVRGGSKLAVVSLDSSRVPDLSDVGFDSAVFGLGFLAMGQGDRLRVLRTSTWEVAFDVHLPDFGPITRLLSEPGSSILGVIGDRGRVRVLKVEPDKNSPSAGSDLVAHSCSSGVGSIVCAEEQNVTVWGGGTASVFGFHGPIGGSRVFPSGVDPQSGNWFSVVQALTEPNVLQFWRKDGSTFTITVDEPISMARLLASGTVVAVSITGAVYTFNATSYVDCCSVWSDPSLKVVHVAAGSRGATGVVANDASGAHLRIFRGPRQVESVTVGDVQWVRQMSFTDSDRFVVLAGTDKIRLFELNDALKVVPGSRDLGCGAPFSIDPSGTKIVCVNPLGDTLQMYSLRTGRLEREFVGHFGPIDSLSLGADLVRAAGDYAGRPDTLVSMWNESD